VDKAANSTPEIFSGGTDPFRTAKKPMFQAPGQRSTHRLPGGRSDALCWFMLVPAQAAEDALHASSRSMNEQASAESRMRVVGTAMGTTRNQLKTERISTQAEADARCTQWHRLCLTPF